MILATLLLSSCIFGAKKAPPLTQEEVKHLKSVEVRNFEGEALDSIMGWRDNSIKGPQKIDIDKYRLKITGLVDDRKSYTYDDVLKMQSYKKVLYLHCVEGWSKKILWEGVLVRDLLHDAGTKPDANTVIFHAEDGYTTSLPLDYFLNNDILLAYKMNGVTLIPERGYPLELVSEQKWGYKWIKWVTEIELSDNPDYRGYWESKGYNQEGDVEGPKRDL
jgi:DMSO/TMAO reductase YedYZ molybdopterin-dependent catalytic subunit